MSTAESNRMPETALTAETGFRAPAPVRPDESSFHELASDVGPSHSMRNFTAEALHALRRRRRAAGSAGLIIGAILATAAWLGVTRQHTATAVLRVSAGQSNILDAASNRETSSF